MKLPQITARPGFELIFALSIAAIFIIPSMVMAQTQKSTEIIITNGDTVINGKNIKTLTPQERADALADMNKLKGNRGNRREFRIERRMDGRSMTPMPPMITQDAPVGHQFGDYLGGSSPDRPMRLKRKLIDTNMVFNFRMDGEDHPFVTPRIEMNTRPRVEFFKRPDGFGAGRAPRTYRPNSQRFSYSNTNGEGVTTNLNYSVTDPMPEEMDAAASKKLLDISDIKLVPDFSTGKTTLSFTLPARATTEIELTNSDGKIIWSEKASVENFSRSFPLPLNGMYHLMVKQGGKSVAKNIMKEE